MGMPYNDNEDYIAWTDGGCIRNPGGKGGYGVVILEKATNTIHEYSAGYLSTTNNRMEIRAAIVALEHIPEGNSVLLISDSQLMLNCLTGAWKRKVNLDLWKILDREAAKHQIRTEWVRGHNGNPLNERCDALATAAMGNSCLLTDEGYILDEHTENTAEIRKQPGDTRNVPDIPEDLEGIYTNPEGVQVNAACSAAIAALPDEPSFRRLAGIRTGGMDGWSRMSGEKLRNLFPKQLLRFVEKQFPSESDAMACLRWYGRGMTLRNAVRKTQADLEIAERFAHEGKRST